MKTLRKPTKADIILNMFEEIGATYTYEEVCQVAGIKNYNSLKAMLSYIRNAEHAAEGSRIDIRLDGTGRCVRVN